MTRRRREVLYGLAGVAVIAVIALVCGLLYVMPMGEDEFTAEFTSSGQLRSATRCVWPGSGPARCATSRSSATTSRSGSGSTTRSDSATARAPTSASRPPSAATTSPSRRRARSPSGVTSPARRPRRLRTHDVIRDSGSVVEKVDAVNHPTDLRTGQSGPRRSLRRRARDHRPDRDGHHDTRRPRRRPRPRDRDHRGIRGRPERRACATGEPPASRRADRIPLLPVPVRRARDHPRRRRAVRLPRAAGGRTVGNDQPGGRQGQGDRPRRARQARSGHPIVDRLTQLANEIGGILSTDGSTVDVDLSKTRVDAPALCIPTPDKGC